MLKEIKKGIIIGIVGAMLISPITVHAETPQEKWIRIQKESNEKFMAGVEADGNLTEDAEKSLSWNKKETKKVKESKKETKTVSNNKTTLVYGVDELHITGLPTDEKGYTKAGQYSK